MLFSFEVIEDLTYFFLDTRYVQLGGRVYILNNDRFQTPIFWESQFILYISEGRQKIITISLQITYYNIKLELSYIIVYINL